MHRFRCVCVCVRGRRKVFIYEFILWKIHHHRKLLIRLFLARVRSLSFSTEQQDIIIMIARMRSDSRTGKKKSTPLPTHAYNTNTRCYYTCETIRPAFLRLVCCCRVINLFHKCEHLFEKGSTCPV